jgi:hypothetical protein
VAGRADGTRQRATREACWEGQSPLAGGGLRSTALQHCSEGGPVGGSTSRATGEPAGAQRQGRQVEREREREKKKRRQQQQQQQQQRAIRVRANYLLVRAQLPSGAAGGQGQKG